MQKLFGIAAFKWTWSSGQWKPEWA